MAKRVVVTMIDDLDKVSPADETVEFALDGVRYEIDLTSAHSAELRDALSMWIPHARQSDTRKSANDTTPKPRPISERDESAKIRAWARSAGYAMAPRGRIAIEVRRAYENAI